MLTFSNQISIFLKRKGFDIAYNALGRHFCKGMSLIDIVWMFPDDETTEAWFIQIRWKERMECPRCSSDNVQEKTTHPTMPHRCRKCRKFFSVKTGTVMETSNLGYQVWAIAIYMLTTNLKSVSSMKLQRDLGVTQKAAWHLAHRIRETYATSDLELITHPVEVDKTYMGGVERNKHKDKKLISCRGAVDKTAVVGTSDRAGNRVAAKVVYNVKNRYWSSNPHQRERGVWRASEPRFG